MEPSETGGAIRHARTRQTKIPKSAVAFTKKLYEDDDIDEKYTYDHESALYSHFGGRLSGKGAKHDSPRTVRFMSHTLKNFPSLLATYHSGRVPNPPHFRYR